MIFKKKPKVNERKVMFAPKEDITAYEIAIILQNVSGFVGLSGVIVVRDNNPIPDTISRHFEEVKG